MAIYIKKVSDTETFAVGDEGALAGLLGGEYDLKITEDEWEAARCVARIDPDTGEIVLGPSAEELDEEWKFTIRNERRLRLKKCDKMNPMWWASMTPEKQQEWIDFRQALLDIPQLEGFPWGGDVTKVPWPTKPED